MTWSQWDPSLFKNPGTGNYFLFIIIATLKMFKDACRATGVMFKAFDCVMKGRTWRPSRGHWWHWEVKLSRKTTVITVETKTGFIGEMDRGGCYLYRMGHLMHFTSLNQKWSIIKCIFIPTILFLCIVTVVVFFAIVLKGRVHQKISYPIIYWHTCIRSIINRHGKNEEIIPNIHLISISRCLV